LQEKGQATRYTMFLKLDNIYEIAFPSFPVHFLFLTLTTEFGKGFTETNLKYMRQFYLTYQKRHALRSESTKLISNLGFAVYEIIFNIIFPFFITYFEQKKKKQFLEFLCRIFVVHPSLADNSVTKYMKLQLFGQHKDAASKVINNVVRYFGLIQLHTKENI